MYLTVLEDVETGAWDDDPEGFDTLDRARVYCNEWRDKATGRLQWAIYHCRREEVITAS